MFIVSPSVLAADFSQLGAEIKKVEKAGADYVHLDVMDGIFASDHFAIYSELIFAQEQA